MYSASLILLSFLTYNIKRTEWQIIPSSPDLKKIHKQKTNLQKLPFPILDGNQYCQYDLSILPEDQHCGSKLQSLAILIKEHINWDCSPQSTDADKYQFTGLLVVSQAITHFFNFNRTIVVVVKFHKQNLI